jgi:hypothetical protein
VGRCSHLPERVLCWGERGFGRGWSCDGHGGCALRRLRTKCQAMNVWGLNLWTKR